MQQEMSIAAMERLAQVMNDSPSIVKLSNTEFAITALKPAVQWLIAEETCKVTREESMSMSDIIKQFSVNIPSIAKIITLAILNDKDRIYSDYKKKVFSDEYQSVYDTLMWETQPNEWLKLFSEILQLINVDFFLASTNVVKTLQAMSLMKKTRMEKAE